MRAVIQRAAQASVTLKETGERRESGPGMVTLLGVELGTVLGGAVVTETVFAWPGVGRLLVTAVSGRDFPVVQGVTIMVAVVVLLINLLVDIAYAYVDPRIRF